MRIGNSWTDLAAWIFLSQFSGSSVDGAYADARIEVSQGWLSAMIWWDVARNRNRRDVAPWSAPLLPEDAGTERSLSSGLAESMVSAAYVVDKLDSIAPIFGPGSHAGNLRLRFRGWTKFPVNRGSCSKLSVTKTVSPRRAWFAAAKRNSQHRVFDQLSGPRPFVATFRLLQGP